MSTNVGWDWQRFDKARWNIVDYGYTLGERVASPDIVAANRQPIVEWIQVRKAAISEARAGEIDPSKRNAIMPESLLLLELTQTLIIISSNYAD
jgi:hypothetical protein